jgi:competence protein ComGC
MQAMLVLLLLLLSLLLLLKLPLLSPGSAHFEGHDSRARLQLISSQRN